MKKLLAFLLLCLPFFGISQTSHVVTFKVNTANITVGSNGLYLGGGVIGGANAVQLTDIDGNGVYEGTDTLSGAGGGNFIFLNSPSWSGDWGTKENLTGLACADASNYNDRILPTFTQDTTLMFCYGTCATDTVCPVTATNPDVTFRVDMSNVSASFTNVYVSGTLNSWSGNANQLTDADGDGIYEGDISLAAGNYEFKFTYDNWVGQESLDATLDSACTLTTGIFTNRYITIGASDTTLPAYCWEECTSCASNLPQTYCSVSFSTGCSLGDYIDDVTIGTFSDTNTGCSTGNYYDGTSDTIEISLADPVAVSLTAGYTNQFYGIWIDLNDDGDFGDTGEFVWSSTSASSTAGTAMTGSFTIPSTFSTGTYRLRIIDRYGGSQMLASESCTGTTYGEYHDYTVKVNPASSCGTPLNLSAVTTTTAAGLDWDATTANYYVVEYDTTGFTLGTGDTVWVYTDTAYITGLTANTAYDFYVKGICTGATSNAASVTGIFMQCAAIATPWSENFDNATTGSTFNPSLPQCWDFYTDGVGSFYYPYFYNRNYSFYANSGTNFLYGYRSSSTSTSAAYGDTTMIITPEILGLDSATKQLEFYARTTSFGRPGEVLIGLTDAAGTPSSLRIVDTVYAPATTYNKYTVYLDGATTGDARIAFMLRRTPGTYDYICIDDVSVTDIPPCPEPIGLALNSTTKSTATISWSSSSAAFSIEVGPMGFTQGTGTSATSTTTSYTATGLTQNTYYDAYVMANCTSTGDGTSNWAGPFTFKTECGAFASPYSEDFGYSDGSGSSANPDLPDCWEHQNLAAYTFNYGYVDKYYFYGNQATDSAYMYLRTYYSQSSSQTALGDTNMMILPRIAGLENGTMQISFNARSVSTSAAYLSDIAVATIDSNKSIASLSIVDTVQVTSTTYSDYSLDLDNVASDAAHVVLIAFGGSNTGYTYGYNGAYFDKLEIRQVLPCKTPGNPELNYTTSTAASLSWNGSQGSTFTIKYGPSGFNQSTGATQIVSSDSNTVLTGLQPNTEYDVLVQNNCTAVGDGLSYWSTVASFKTTCPVQGMPLVENFESTPGGNTASPMPPNCWEFASSRATTTIYGYNSASSYYANGGTNSFRMYSSNDSTTAFDSIQLISPNLGELRNKSIELNFAVRPSSVNYNTSLYVNAYDSTNALVSTIAIIPLEQTIGSTSYESFSYTLDSLVGASKIGFQLKGNGSSYQGFNIDDIEINEITECYYVQNFRVDTIGTDMAKFSWDHRFSDSVQITVVPEGFGKNNGTSYSSASGSLTVNGLISGASYDVYYDEYCSTGLSGFEQMSTITTMSTFAPCEITFELYDSYNDGWNNGQFGYRLLTDNNGTILDSGILTMSSGGQATISVNTSLLNQTDSVEVYHISSGAYPSEMSMAIYDGTGMLVDSITSGNYFASFKFAPGCAGGGCIASALNITGGQTFAIFEHSADTIRYSVQAIGSTLNTASIIETTDSTFTINGFTYYTGYQVYYQMPCTDGSWTPWAVKFFETSCNQLNYSFGNSPSSNTCSQLIFSEYNEGSSNNKGFEIYNPADSAISLSGYTIYLSGNGGSYTNSFTSSAMIASGDVYVIVTNQADTVLQAQADTALSYPSVAHYNGDDALILVQGTDTIDIIGVPGVDPGSSWAVDSGSTANHTLVRKSTVNYGSTDWTTGAGEWDVYAQNTYSNFGFHSYTCAQVVDTSGGNNEYCYGESIQYVLSGDAIAESFKWYRDGVLAATTTTPVFSIANATPNESGNYTVIVENRCGTQELTLGSVSVSDTIGVSAVSAITNTCLDLDAQISFITSGPISNRELSFDAIPYAYGIDSLLISSVSYSDSGTYELIVSNSCETKSSSVTLNVIEGTTITSISPETYICTDSTEAIYVAGLGNSLQYAWTANGVSVANSNNDTILIPSPSDSTFYAVQVSGICSADTAKVSLANSSVVIRKRQSSEITTSQSDLVLCEGQTIDMGFEAIGHNLQYSWLKDGDVISRTQKLSINNAKGLGSAGGNYNFYGSAGLRFRASVPFELDSVTIYPNSAGFTAISIRDSATNNVLWNKIVNTTASNGGSEQVYLGANLNSGSYTIIADSSSTGGLYREYGVTGYPYSTGNNEVTITSGSLTSYHYFFYDWKLTVGSADTTYTLANAMHGESGTYQFSVSGTCGVDTSAEVVVDVRKTTDYLAGMSNIEVCVGDEFTMPLSYDGHDVSVAIHKVGSTLPIALTTSTISGCGELFFSEYIEGSSNNKGFEIFNPSSNAVSLSGYTVYLSGNGGTYTNTFTSNATIAPGDVYVICTNQASSTMQAVADTILSYPSVSHYNGDDALILVNGTDTIDVIGVPGVDPGSSWTVGTGSTANHTLVRKANIGEGSTDWATGSMEWDVYAQNTYSYLGSHTFTCSSNTISTAFGLSNISYNDQGSYYAEFDGSCGTVYSDTIYVTVHTTTAITSTFSNPLNVICEDAGIDFSFAVEGHGLTYSWNQDGSAVGSDSTLQINTADTAQSGFYQLITSGTCGVDTSQVLQLIVHPTTQVLSTFADTSICQDADMTLPVASDGFGVTYKWYQNGTQISTSSSLVITDGLSSDNGEYQLALNGYCGADSSNTFDVLVMPSTEVFTSIGDTTACIDDALTLAVHDTGFMNSYQWYKDGAIIASAMDSTFDISVLSAADTGSYQLVATGSCGTDSSAILPIGAWETTAILTSSQSFDICKGDQAQMYLNAECDFLSYSWSKDGINLPGSVDDTLILNNVLPAFAGYFIGTVTGVCGTSMTDTIQMDVHQVPNVTMDPISDTLCQYDSTSLSVSATGFGVVYNWYYNGAMVGTGNVLNLDSITYAEQGFYTAVADGFCGIDTAQAAYVKVDAILPSLSLSTYSFEICELDTVVVNASSLLGQSVSGNWYKDSILVHSGLAYNLTDSGDYYVALTDLTTGCVETTPSANVIMRPVPQPLAISGDDTLYQNTPHWYWVNQEANVDYDWSIPSGVIVAGWFSDSIEVQFSGSGAHMVYVEATNEFECTTNLDLEVLISGIGFDENNLVNFKVYPNPTVGRTVLELDQAVSADMKVEIIDAKGAIVHRGKLLKGATEYRMDMTALRNGQYLIQIPQLGISVPIVKTN